MVGRSAPTAASGKRITALKVANTGEGADCQYRADMSRTPSGQFRVVMPDGLIIERLPVGLANRRWRLAFVASGVDLFTGPFRPMDRPAEGVSSFQAFYDRVKIEGVGAELNSPHGGAGCDGTEYEYAVAYDDNGLTAFHVTYLHEGSAVASEVLDIT